ncbi:MAG TPA: ATP-binding protein [Pyrinomonadaceae bacterium]|jgi:two-component system sensor histidine kinase CpxA
MRSLFLKVFLWFWLAMVLVIAALAITSYLTRSEPVPRPPQFIEAIVSAYSRTAVDTFEREGAAGLSSFLERVERDANIRAYLFDSGGTELSGRNAAPEERELALRAARSGNPASKMLGGGMVIEAKPVPARDGGRYVFVSVLPLGPPRPPGDSPGSPRPPRPLFGPFNFLLGESTTAFVLRLLAVVLTAGLLCYLLARYIVSPVVKLREVTRRVAGGDLSARVSPMLGRRSDELAAMGHDFDAMASKIETLMMAQQRLLRDISHELRSPLARLNVALDLARKRAGADAASALSRIELESNRLSEMISQLLVLTRRESSSNGFQHERIDLAEVVREVVADADFEARNDHRAVRITVCDECRTIGAGALLRSAIENVVRNAVRYTMEGTTVEVSLQCRENGGGKYALIRVRDFGTGVPEEMLADIFKPFYRVEEARDRESGGTGLGLAISERAIRLHDGTITAENLPEGGFLIEIRLPVKSRS